MEYYDELYHFGVKGMKWGVRKDRKKVGLGQRIRDREERIIGNRERRALVADAKKVTAKAPKGDHMMVTGKYSQRNNDRMYSTARHLVNDRGEVKLSYINGLNGDRYIAAGKSYISKLDMSQYFRNIQNMNIEYDVYD